MGNLFKIACYLLSLSFEEHRKGGVCGEFPEGQYPLHEAAGLRYGVLVQRTVESTVSST